MCCLNKGRHFVNATYVLGSVADPDPDRQICMFLSLLDPDPLVRDMDPDHLSKIVRKTLIPTVL